MRASRRLFDRLRFSSCRLLAIVLLSAGLGACAGRAGSTAGPLGEPADPCRLEPAPETAPSSLTIAVTAPIAARHLWLDANPAERFLVAHLYETLVRVDCRGAFQPGLAKSWRFDAGQRRWLLTLRDEARFWNGEPARAVDVLGAWREAALRDGGTGTARVLEGAEAPDGRTLSIPLGEDSLRVLADPAFLVRRARPGSDWPEGTGPYRLVSAEPAGPSAAGNALSPLRLEPMYDARAPRLTVHSVSAAAARDLVDVGVDLLLTDAPDLIAYAASQPGLDSAALAWSRLYLLMTTSSSASTVDTQRTVPYESSRAQRDVLARDVVRVSARGVTPPGWWTQGLSCVRTATQGAVPVMRGPGALGVAYDRTDPVAQALAERIAAVTAMGGRGEESGANALIPPSLLAAGSRVTAVGLPSAEFASALRDGATLAFVLAVPVRELAPCVAQDRILRRAPWLGAAGLSVTGAVVPLVETHWTALHRPDRLGLRLHWDGTPVLVSNPVPARSGR
ncbi:MAG TPA: ABC transporter substrate-binding protein [Gemmatimonadaceae bacterium]|nr:ABC transporter substrate-binding protein [Gemmatimonadaceae bacterium]